MLAGGPPSVCACACASQPPCLPTCPLPPAHSPCCSNLKGGPTYLKALHRKGQGLLGLGRHREAVGVFEEGVRLDPLNPDLKLGLQAANEGLLRDLVEGERAWLCCRLP